MIDEDVAAAIAIVGTLLGIVVGASLVIVQNAVDRHYDRKEREMNRYYDEQECRLGLRR